VLHESAWSHEPDWWVAIGTLTLASVTLALALVTLLGARVARREVGVQVKPIVVAANSDAPGAALHNVDHLRVDVRV
jgi:hypothetical protein